MASLKILVSKYSYETMLIDKFADVNIDVFRPIWAKDVGNVTNNNL